MFASSARTTIPPTPTVGIPYRKPTLTASEASDGWPFSTVVDSANFNEVMYRVTTVLDFIEKNGGITWSSLTDYPVGALVRDDSFTFYEALQASGPNNGGSKIPSASPTYWKVATFHFYGGGYRVVFIGTNYNSNPNELVYCRVGCTVALPTSPADQDRVKIITSEFVDGNSPVIVTGQDIQKTGITSVLLDNPISFIEFVWDAVNSMWKIEGLVCGGQTAFVDSQIRLVPPMNKVLSTSTVTLTNENQQLRADVKLQSDMGLFYNPDGLGIRISTAPTNSIHLVNGELYSGAVDEDEIHLIEKQQVFFDGEGSQLSLGELDVGNWSDDPEWPLPWDFGDIQRKGQQLTCFGDVTDTVNGVFELTSQPTSPFTRVWTMEKVVDGVEKKYIVEHEQVSVWEGGVYVGTYSRWNIDEVVGATKTRWARQTNSDHDETVPYEDPTSGIWLDANGQEIDIQFAFLSQLKDDNIESFIDFGVWSN